MYVLLSHQKNEKANLDQKKTSCSSLCIPPEYLEEAMFAGGSFWGVEAAFGRVKGVAKTSTGYYGGSLRKPTYREVQNVSNVKTGHTEAVKVVYDKRIVSFTSLCEVFWDTHDPTDKEFLVLFFPSPENENLHGHSPFLRPKMDLVPAIWRENPSEVYHLLRESRAEEGSPEIEGAGGLSKPNEW
ncbi:Peptide methionine sulfoxide reductase [Nymphaea thermarum]|nr:Peptide methionine sulfoxide reductase [Nymphaea thermarum]